MQPGADFPADPQLRDQLHAADGVAVLTGGQTGVDSYAARAALDAGLSVHLVFPNGLRQEDGSLTPARRRRLSGAAIHELAAGSFRVRTWACVWLADAVLLLCPAGGAGCQETARAAGQLGRPLLTAAPGQLTAAQTASWLSHAAPRVLMVAGCRASVLARGRAGRGAHTELTTIMAAVAARNQDLLAGRGECPASS
jgi:hypothetical protein